MKPLKIVLAALVTLVLTGCAARQESAGPGLEEVARSDEQWTGVAVSREGRMFVNYPLWGSMENSSVWEILPTGEVRPYPDPKWNYWEPGLPADEHFVCVQSVYVDAENFLWILDPASPRLEGVVPGGPKLVKVDLGTDQVVGKILFDLSVAPADSYLNDVRVDTGRDLAYLTDSGAGALVVVDLVTGRSRRVLEHHSSTQSENIPLVIDGKEWRLTDGSLPQVHADGIGLTGDGEYLYYQALTGRTLYRIETKWLRNPGISGQELASKVEYVETTGPVDGIMFGPDGNLYLSAIPDQAIRRYLPAEQRIETVAQDPRLEWPDSFAQGPEGAMYVTTSRIHLGFSNPGPYRLFRFRPTSAP